MGGRPPTAQMAADDAVAADAADDAEYVAVVFPKCLWVVSQMSNNINSMFFVIAKLFPIAATLVSHLR